MDVDPMQADVAVDDVADDCGKGCCDVCCDQSSFIFGAEVTFFKFHEANGVNDADFNDASFDRDANLRLTAGYVGCDGLGARVRYWEYDESALSVANNPIFVDTYTLDFEVFQQIELGSCTCVEVFGGLRYNEFDFFRDDGAIADDQHAFDGLGGIIGLEVHRDLCNGLGLYARLREVIMADDANFFGAGGEENDTIRPVTEIALGVSYTSCNWSLRAGYEWQVWGNYVESAGATNLDFEATDIGFAGFVVGAQYAY
jgi:hypothetical protein